MILQVDKLDDETHDIIFLSSLQFCWVLSHIKPVWFI